jgi:hypothetical protein
MQPFKMHLQPQPLCLMSCCVLLQDEPACDGEVVLSFENKSPIQETFQFQRISGGLIRWG